MSIGRHYGQRSNVWLGVDFCLDLIDGSHGNRYKQNSSSDCAVNGRFSNNITDASTDWALYKRRCQVMLLDLVVKTARKTQSLHYNTLALNKCA